ncbi:MAG TPA: rod shape-determining protein RodA [Armatimonadota bacterium]|nr:rod shape-determining protein RodA [Armatimonadota bacterium]
MVDTRFFRRADFVMLACVIILISIGCVMIFSCTRGALSKQGLAQTKTVRMQLIWVLVGLAAMFVMMAIDYSRVASFHMLIYGVTALLLVAVFFCRPINGAYRWIIIGPIRLQPAEFAQLAMVIFIASMTSAQEKAGDFFAITKTFAWMIPVIVLILKEPDLGTPVLMFVVWASMMFLSGARIQHLVGYASAGVLLFLAAWFSGAISDEQKARILVFLHPELYRHGDGYQQYHSLIAVGSGGVFGQGLFQGKQTQGAWIPDQHTDFIFTGIAEEFGFIGAVLVLALFGLLLWRCTVVMFESKDLLGRLLVCGVTAMIGMHVLVNVSMTMALGPVKGMPLPLVSYGGSSMLTTLMGLGIVQSVHMRRHKIAF